MAAGGGQRSQREKPTGADPVDANIISPFAAAGAVEDQDTITMVHVVEDSPEQAARFIKH